MAKKTLETSDSPQIIVEKVGSDLQVKGWDRTEVFVKSSSDNDIVLEQQDENVIVSCPSDCVLYIPEKSNLEVRNVGSDARFRSIEGNINIGKIGTDLSIKDIGSAQIETVGSDFYARRVRDALSIKKVGSSALVQDAGDTDLEVVGNQLIAKRVRGNLKVRQIGSSVIARDIDGQVTFDNIGGTLHLRDVNGGIHAILGGAATIDFSPVSWQAYFIQAAGNIRCQIPDDANAEFNINCGSHRIRIHTSEQKETFKEGSYTLTMGDGGASVKLTAGGSVNIVGQRTGMGDAESFEFDLGGEFGSLADEIAEQTTQQIEAQMELLEEQLSTQLAGLSASLSSTGMSEERMKELQERLERAKERAESRAASASQRAQEKMERKIAAAQRKAERKARATAAREARKQRQRLKYTEPSVVIKPPVRSERREPVSEEERMMILQMLQDKKISVEQAETLLSALEG
ncbi:MAG: SHOCT-like domain-containing protein [Anaerolineales bacterium]